MGATNPDEAKKAAADQKAAEEEQAKAEVEQAVAEKKASATKEELGVHPKVAKKLTEMSDKVNANTDLKKKAEAAYDKYKKSPSDALKNVTPEVRSKAQQAWNGLHKDAGVN